MLTNNHLDNVIEVILSREARRPSGSAATQLFSMLNSSRLTHWDRDLGMLPVWSWLYLENNIFNGAPKIFVKQNIFSTEQKIFA